MPDRFDLLNQLGRGGMGTVWRARDRYSRQIVAVKLLHPALAEDPYHLARLEREVEVAQRIDCPNVVRVLGYGQQDGQPYIAMEYVEGQSLRDLISAGRTKDFSEWGHAKSVLRQLANALDAAHRVGVIHRDIKPANVMIDESGNVKLADFGIAKAVDMSGLTGGVTVLGTPAYMAPDLEVSEQSDLYAVGCVIYEMVTGSPPFEGSSPQTVLIKHLREAPDLSRIPENLRDMVRWLLEKDPAKRPKSARELLETLLPTGGGSPVAAVVEPEVRDRRGWLWVRRGALALATVGIGGAAAALWVASEGDSPAGSRARGAAEATPRPTIPPAPPPGPPVIEEFSVSPADATFGETVVVNFRFSDPDGDTVRFVTRYLDGVPWKFGSRLETELDIRPADQWTGAARAEQRFECLDFYDSELEFTLWDSSGWSSAPQVARFACRPPDDVPVSPTSSPPANPAVAGAAGPSDTVRFDDISHSRLPASDSTTVQSSFVVHLRSASQATYRLSLRLFSEVQCRGEVVTVELLERSVEGGESALAIPYAVGPFGSGSRSLTVMASLERRSGTISSNSSCMELTH